MDFEEFEVCFCGFAAVDRLSSHQQVLQGIQAGVICACGGESLANFSAAQRASCSGVAHFKSCARGLVANAAVSYTTWFSVQWHVRIIAHLIGQHIICCCLDAVVRLPTCSRKGFPTWCIGYRGKCGQALYYCFCISCGFPGCLIMCALSEHH